MDVKRIPIVSFRVQLKKDFWTHGSGNAIEKFLYNPVTEDDVYEFRKELEFLFKEFNRVCDFEVTFDYSVGMVVTPKAMRYLESLCSIVSTKDEISLNNILNGESSS